MQIIVQHEDIGIWLMPGKSNDGRIDREHFQKRIQNNQYMERFYSLLIGLGSNYWIEVADDFRDVTSFNSVSVLQDYLQKDRWRYYYFTIGRNYDLGSKELLSKNIVDTVLSDFSKYQPLYDL